MVERCGGVVARVLVLCLAGCPGSGPGGAPITQGGASPTSPIPTTPTPTTAPAGASREAARTLQTGGDADFDGDGKLDARTKIDGDTRTTIYYGSPGKTRLTVVLRPDRVDLQGDFNEDGTIDFKHSGATVAGVRTQTSTWDTDFDGAVDETETLTITGELGRGQPVTVTPSSLATCAAEPPCGPAHSYSSALVEQIAATPVHPESVASTFSAMVRRALCP